MSMNRYLHAFLSVVLVASAAFGGVQTLNTGDSGAGASVYYSQTASSGNIHPDPTGAFYASVWCKPNTAPHWKDEGSHHGFLMPVWWKDRAMYGRKPVGGRSVLHLVGAKDERVRMAREILADGTGVFDDIWNGLTPADLGE